METSTVTALPDGSTEVGKVLGLFFRNTQQSVLNYFPFASHPNPVVWPLAGPASRAGLCCCAASGAGPTQTELRQFPEGRSGWTSAISLLGPNSPASGHQAPRRCPPTPQKRNQCNSVSAGCDAATGPWIRRESPATRDRHQRRPFRSKQPHSSRCQAPRNTGFDGQRRKEFRRFLLSKELFTPARRGGGDCGLRWSAVDRERSRLWGKAGGIAPGRRGGA